ncbi:MAG: ATP-binding protein, partial [Shewanella sp.]
MEVKKITLHNVGRFDELEILLAPLGNLKSNVTVFVGNNGSGKTSVLRSLATSLSWLVSRIQSEKGTGSPIPELVIKNGKTSASIDLDVYHFIGNEFDPDAEGESDDGNYFPWSVAKVRKGRKGEFKSEYWGATALADHYRTLLSIDNKASLPLIAFYSVERVVIDIPLKIKDKHSFLQLDGYDKSLSQGVDFR